MSDDGVPARRPGSWVLTAPLRAGPPCGDRPPSRLETSCFAACCSDVRARATCSPGSTAVAGTGQRRARHGPRHYHQRLDTLADELHCSQRVEVGDASSATVRCPPPSARAADTLDARPGRAGHAVPSRCARLAAGQHRQRMLHLSRRPLARWFTTARARALPAGAGSRFRLSGWSLPVSLAPQQRLVALMPGRRRRTVSPDTVRGEKMRFAGVEPATIARHRQQASPAGHTRQRRYDTLAGAPTRARRPPDGTGRGGRRLDARRRTGTG